MNPMDELLDKAGLTFDQLKPNEKQWLLQKVNALTETQLSVEKIREAVHAMKVTVEQELTQKKEIQPSFVTLLTLFIPLVGIIRKWYQDQREVELRARLRNYLALETLLTASQRQKKEIEQALLNISEGIG